MIRWQTGTLPERRTADDQIGDQVSARPEQPEPFLRGCLYPGLSDAAYPRANPTDSEHLPTDVWQAAQVPAGVRLEFVGEVDAVRIFYKTTTANLGYRGEGAGCTFSLYRSGQKIAEEEAVLGEGVVQLPLYGEPSRPAIVYLPEGMRPIITGIEGIGGYIEPAPRQPRWLCYGDAVTQGWLASVTGPCLAGGNGPQAWTRPLQPRLRGLDAIRHSLSAHARRHSRGDREHLDRCQQLGPLSRTPPHCAQKRSGRSSPCCVLAIRMHRSSS